MELLRGEEGKLGALPGRARKELQGYENVMVGVGVIPPFAMNLFLEYKDISSSLSSADEGWCSSF